MNRTRRQVRRWPMVMIRRPLPHGARKRASYVEGCAAACGDSASRFRPPKHLNLMSSPKIFGSGIPIIPPGPEYLAGLFPIACGGMGSSCAPGD